jgi:hypothetical protein
LSVVHKDSRQAGAQKSTSMAGHFLLIQTFLNQVLFKFGRTTRG